MTGLKLGSLFDGAGGFPLAGVYAGFEPVWAAEIEPFPIRVTTRRLPGMKHLGDISRINGAEIEPVDVITFGSPCQDLSLANSQRKGLDGSDGCGGRNSGGFIMAAFISGQSAEARSIGYSEKVTPTLKADAGENTIPCVMAAGFNGHKSITGNICYKEERSPCIETQMPPNVLEQTVYSLVSKSSNSWKSDNPHSGCYETEQARTIDTSGGDPTCNQGGNIVVYPDKARSLTARHDSSPCIDRGQNFIAVENNAQDSRVKLSESVVQTLPGKMGTGGNNTPMVMMPIPIDLRQAVKNSERGDNCGMGVGEPGDNAFTITNGQPHGIAYDCRNHTANEKVNPTLQAKQNGGQSLNYINPVFTIGNGQPDGTKLNEKAGTLNCMHDQQAVMICTETKYIIRRLTPLECCRLQGFPDFWAEGLENPEPTEQEIDWWSVVFETHRLATEPDKKPKTRNQIRKWLTSPHSDSAEYRMWGNSLAIPCAYNVLSGIAEVMK